MTEAEIDEMFAGLGPVKIRRMFGGKGVYHDGLILAVEIRGEMRLKADALSAPEFETVGATRWAYEGKAGKPVLMPYWSVPDAAWDDPDEMARFVGLAVEAARRGVASAGDRTRRRRA